MKDTNIGESPSFKIDILESKTPLRIVEENTLLLDEIQPSMSSALPADNTKTKRLSSKMAENTESQSPTREETVTEVEETKELLANIEMARLKTQAKIQVHLERNAIEKEKVKAINNLASAAWAFVNIFKSNMEGNKRKCDGCGSDQPMKRSHSHNSDSD